MHTHTRHHNYLMCSTPVVGLFTLPRETQVPIIMGCDTPKLNCDSVYLGFCGFTVKSTSSAYEIPEQCNDLVPSCVPNRYKIVFQTGFFSDFKNACFLKVMA